MTRNNRRNSRAARRTRIESLQATIDGLQHMHQRASARDAQARVALDKTSSDLQRTASTLRDREDQLVHLRQDRHAMIESARRLVNMVRAECISNPATMSRYAPNRLRESEWLFYLTAQQWDLDNLIDRDAAFAVRTIQETMYLLRELPALVDRINGHVHVRVRLGDKQVGYGISHSALMAEDEDTLIERISEEMASGLLRELRAAKRGGGESMPPHRRFGG